jgi:hypothetical protein
VCVCMRFVDKTILSKVESREGKLTETGAKPGSQGLSSALSEPRAFSNGIAKGPSIN